MRKIMWNQLMKRSTIFPFQFFFVGRNRSLVGCENYSPFRLHKGVLVYQTWKLKPQQYAASKLITSPYVAARLAKINNAGQRQWCKLVAQCRSPWRAGPELSESLSLHYNLQLADLPSHCARRDRFIVSHALSCKKGGFVAQRHDVIQNLLTSLLRKVCKDVEEERPLLPIDKRYST